MIRLHVEACKAFDKRIVDIQELVQSKPPPKHPPSSIDPDTHIAATITEADIVGDMILGTVDPFGNSLERWIFLDGNVVGLDGEAFQSFQAFYHDLRIHKAFRDCVSQEFIEERTFTWLTDHAQETAQYSDYIQSESNMVQVESEHWIPIAHLRTTRPINVGNVVFKRISKTMIDAFEQSQQPYESDDEKQSVEAFILRLRRKCQGFTAGTITITAELERGRELAYEYVDTALSMFRFFEPGSVDPNQTSHLMPFGQEAKGTKSSFVVENGVPGQWTEGQIARVSMDSVYRTEFIDEMGEFGLDAISRILTKEQHTSYESKLLEALIIYSRVSISPRLSDKLVYALVALESIFLRNRTEPIQQNLGERIAFLIGQDRDSRTAIVALIREIYDIRSKVIHHGKDISSSNQESKNSLTSHGQLFVGSSATLIFLRQSMRCCQNWTVEKCLDVPQDLHHLENRLLSVKIAKLALKRTNRLTSLYRSFYPSRLLREETRVDVVPTKMWNGEMAPYDSNRAPRPISKVVYY